MRSMLGTASEWLEKKEVVVLGAGVVGLTTALKIQETGEYVVTIVAETLPSDPKSIRYTSHWAGAHHVSLAGKDMRQQKMDKETFDVMWALSAPDGAAPGCFLRIPQTEYYADAMPRPHDLEHMPDFEYIPDDALAPETQSGIKFSTITIDTPVYLNWLLARFLAAGGRIVRGAVQHIAQLAEDGVRAFTTPHAGSRALGAKPPAAIVVCAGIGARFLGGVADADVFPIRGQTVLVRAPWVTFGRTISSKTGLWTYIIPRKGGDVIVGGVKVADDWFPSPRAETTDDILRRGLALCPELAPPHIREKRSLEELTVDDVRPLVVEEGCGLRPARRGGIRLEVEWIPAGPKSGTRVPVVFNYGHGGYGFQSSWGSARLAFELLQGALARGEAARDELNTVAAPGVAKDGIGARSW